MPRKRSTGDGGLYLDKKRNLWRAVVDVGFWPDGRRRQKAVTSRTQAGARAKLRDILKDIDEHGEPIDRQTTVAAWAEHWLTTVCKPKLKPNAQSAYESVTRNWIVPTIGKKPVALVKPSDVRAVHKAIADAGRSSSTALKAYQIMSGMLEAARVDGLASKNVAKDVSAPSAAISTRGPLESDEALSVLRTAAQLPDGTKWWTTLLAGLRQAERLGARLDSLDLDAGVLTVEWTLDEIVSEHRCGVRTAGKWPCGYKQAAACPQARLKVPDGFEYVRLHGRLCLIRPKSGKPRYVPLIPPLVEALRRYVEATKDDPNPYGLIWRHPNGEPFLPGEDEQAWRDVLLAAGVIDAEQSKPPKERKTGTPGIPTSHCARHTTATVLMELGVDAKIVGEIVGHQSEAVTRKYQHVSSPAAREAMDRIGEHWRAALEA